MLSWTNSRRVVVQRCPAVPIAPKATPRSARSRSAEGATITPLLPPSSRIARAKRCARRGATARPIRVDPVAETSATRASSTSASPASRPPIKSCDRPSGASPNRAAARSKIACVAKAVSGVFSDGFHTTLLPHTNASAAFHAHTATGKLNAEITPTTPSGCHTSIIRCPGRSVAIVRPYNCRERPTAKSQMSIISCTSPAPSEGILPASIVTSRARSSFAARSSSPNSRTSSPRRGAGTWRHARKAAVALSSVASIAAASATRTIATCSPVSGVSDGIDPSVHRARSTPSPSSNRPTSSPIPAIAYPFALVIAPPSNPLAPFVSSEACAEHIEAWRRAEGAREEWASRLRSMRAAKGSE